MQTTFTQGLNASFYGKKPMSGVPAYAHNAGIRTVGGFISKDNTNKAKFGYAMFAKPAEPDAWFAGSAGGATLFRGVLMNSYFVNEQLPAHADELLNNQPASAIYEGSVWVAVADFAATNVGDSLNADTDGSLKVGTTDAIGKVVDKDEQTELVLLHIN